MAGGGRGVVREVVVGDVTERGVGDGSESSGSWGGTGGQ